ncbi:hypothetical protein, partial [Aeromonas caviae]|uniref:hypothetical protein n=1 Tax=Aeromonas caviae TaxID=648 RepID=UPI001FC7E9AA
MMIYLQKRVIDQNGRSPSSTENSKIRCGMTDKPPQHLVIPQQQLASSTVAFAAQQGAALQLASPALP